MQAVHVLYKRKYKCLINSHHDVECIVQLKMRSCTYTAGIALKII